MTRRAARKSKNSNEAVAVHEQKVHEDYASQATWITENDRIQSTGLSDTALLSRTLYYWSKHYKAL